MSKKINIVVFLGLIFSMAIIFFVKEDELVSYPERRYLTQAEDIKAKDIKNGTIATKLESYALDQFPFRNTFRSIKAFANYNIFMKQENKNIVVTGGSMFEIKSSYKYSQVDDVTAKINSIAASMFYDNNCYFALIPDKSCFLDMDGNDYDYGKIENSIIKNLCSKISYIPIYDTLTVEDYYKTDLHWSQEKILDTKDRIIDYLFNSDKDNIYLSDESSVFSNNANTEEYISYIIEDYKGSYAVKSALSYITDDIIYLNNVRINSSHVYNYETGLTTPVYDLAKLKDEKSLDKYDIFLSGACPLLKVTAPEKTGKTMILFRDSYGSSIAPLLLEYYDTIYLVDLRYINSSLIENFIEINPEYDVLFLYSTSILETSGNFK